MRCLRLGYLFVLVALAACDSFNLPSWLAGPDDPPLPGERIAVLKQEAGLTADASLQESEVAMPEATLKTDWPQEGGNTENLTGNLLYDGKFEKTDSVSIAGGDGYQSVLVPEPVAADGKIFALDGKGRVAAYDTKGLKKIWQYDGLIDKEEESDALGGGVAYENGMLYVLSGRGDVAALSAADGKKLWQQALGIPLRSAPRASGGAIYCLSVDNQLFALDATTGQILWSHRGINETASYLGLVTPAANSDLVIAPYSSGEIKALRAGSGDDAWSDSLSLTQRTRASSIFTGIDANPVIANNILYAVSNGGLLAATDMRGGRRLWEQEISSTNAPVIAGDYIYIVTSDAQLVCLRADDGRIRWVSALPRYEDDNKKKPYLWSGPLMLSGRLVIIGAHGVLQAYSPKDGAKLFEKDIPDNVYVAPILSNDTLYLTTQDAKLVALK